ncbi:MAG: hypothetical protein IIV88_04750 [Erysipelotrichaceae bacterium]|nr:hypothetical protein [Erysipelotrichaceae bacterium]
MIYYLMHANDPITAIDIDDSGNLMNIANTSINKELLPLKYRASPDGLRNWWKERAIPASRHGLTEFLIGNGYSGPLEYLKKNLGLSLTDHYWINPIDSQLTWKKINLFENDFVSDALETSAMPPSASVPVYSANSSLQGDIEKTWIIEDGVRKLIKGNTGDLSSESLNEVLAAEIYRLQEYDNYTPYELVRIKDKEYEFGCSCPAFTSLEKEFVPAYDLVTSEQKPNHLSWFEHFLQLAEKNGADRELLQHDVDVMLLCDYVLSGFDRHLNNLGILRDPKTLRFERLAPVFDSGGSLFAGRELPNTKKDLLRIRTNSFAANERKLLSYVEDKKAIDLNKLPSAEWVRELYRRDPLQSEKRINAVIKAYTWKIDLLGEIQKGRDPYKKDPALQL